VDFTSLTDIRNSASVPAPEPRRDLSINDEPQMVVNQEELVPGTMISTPPPAEPQNAADLLEARAAYSRAIEAVGERDKQLSDLNQKMEELRLQMELMPKAWQPPPQAPALPDGLDPESQVTVKDLFQFAQNFAAAQQNAMEQMEVARIRASWAVPSQRESEILQRFPQLANLPELQKVQAIEKVNRSLYGQGVPAPSAASARPIAASPLSQPMVPNVESNRPSVRDVPVSDNGRAKAEMEYEAAKQIVNPRERAQKMRDAAEKLARLQGTSLDDISGQQWVSRG
jgi:hypothetical protein